MLSGNWELTKQKCSTAQEVNELSVPLGILRGLVWVGLFPCFLRKQVSPDLGIVFEVEFSASGWVISSRGGDGPKASSGLYPKAAGTLVGVENTSSTGWQLVLPCLTCVQGKGLLRFIAGSAGTWIFHLLPCAGPGTLRLIQVGAGQKMGYSNLQKVGFFCSVPLFRSKLKTVLNAERAWSFLGYLKYFKCHQSHPGASQHWDMQGHCR